MREKTFTFLFVLILTVPQLFYGQKDSTTFFKLNKVNICFGFGQAPRVIPTKEINSKIKPYYKFGFSYNIKLKGHHNYLVISLATTLEEFFYSFKTEENKSDFNYIQVSGTNSTVISGTIHQYRSVYRSEKLCYGLLEVGYQKIYSPFNNSHFNFSSYVGFAFKPNVGRGFNYEYDYQTDSINTGSNNVYRIKSESEIDKRKFSFGESFIEYGVANANVGLLYTYKNSQHLFGVDISVQLNTYYNQGVPNTKRVLWGIFYSFYL